MAVASFRVPSGRPMLRFVFLDKDGTLVEDVPYSVDPAQIRLAPGAIEALRMLQAGGFGLAVVSNQSGIARGLFDEAALEVYRRALEAVLAAGGVVLDGFFFCPHHPGFGGPYGIECDCRKPAPGMLLSASEEFGADAAGSWMVGDILDDVEAGHRAGCRSVLVERGNETEWRMTVLRRPDVVVADLRGAAAAILRSPAAADAVAVGAGEGER